MGKAKAFRVNEENINLRCVNCSSILSSYIDRWLYTCQQCGLDQSLLYDEKYNGKEPIGWTESASDFLEKLREDNAKEVLNELSSHMKLEGKSLLDIGCAAGWFLEVANKNNMVTTGIEPELKIAQKGIKKGLQIKNIMFPDKSLADKTYDVITFNDVFEHIDKPGEIICQVNAQLTNDGYLIINLPSSNGIIYKISCLLARIGYLPPLERLWQKGYFSPHLFYYSNENLKNLVEKYGFKLISHNRLDVIRIRGLWNRINHNKSINIVIAGLIYVSTLMAYPLIKYIFPSDIMFHIYKKI